MSVIDNISFASTDERTRKYIFPVRVMETTGHVEQPENLLKTKTLQVGLNETCTTRFLNDGNEKASVLLDFGVEMHGGIRLLAAMGMKEKSPRVHISFGESADEACSEFGVQNAGCDHAQRDFTVPLSTLGEQEFGGTGFRFVRIELADPGSAIAIKAAVAIFIYRDIPYLGSFRCSDEYLNRIYDTAAYTCHLCMQTLVWDGIKRDRLAWIGDLHPEMLTIRSVFGDQKLVEKSLDFVRQQSPLPRWMNGFPSYSMWWVIILYDWYLYTGDEVFLNTQKAYVSALLRQLCDLVQPDGELKNEMNLFFDWPTHDTPAERSGVRSLLNIALTDGIRLAEYFGDAALAETCRNTHTTLETASENNGGAKQTGAFLVLAGRADPVHTTEELLLKGGADGMSTFLTYYTLRAMDEGGHMAEALDILREYYGAMLDVGATTFWEDFHMDWLKNAGRIDERTPAGKESLHGDRGAYCYKGLRHSLCHGWSSGPAAFLAERVLGVQILEPGCRKVRVAPHLGKLSWSEGTYPTPLGILRVRHEVVNGRVESHIEAPAGMEIVRE